MTKCKKCNEPVRCACWQPTITVSTEPRVQSRPSIEELEAAWADLWKHLGEPEYSPSAISLAKHCFMVGQEWGANRAAQRRLQRRAGETVVSAHTVQIAGEACQNERSSFAASRGSAANYWKKPYPHDVGRRYWRRFGKVLAPRLNYPQSLAPEYWITRHGRLGVAAKRIRRTIGQPPNAEVSHECPPPASTKEGA